MIQKILCLLLFSLSCYGASIGEENNQFALSLFSKMNKREHNVAFSPYSVFSNLSLLYFGAEGDTAQEIKSVLHLSETGESFLQDFHKQLHTLTTPMEKGYQLKIANGLFPDKGTQFLKKFTDLAENTFEAHLQPLDYAEPETALNAMNRWIFEKTEEKIPNFIEKNDLDKSTRLISANAVYFEGEWVYPFQENQIEKGTFFPENYSPLEVDMLKQIRRFPYYENEDIQVLHLPFVRGGKNKQPYLECVLVLPKQKNGLKKLEPNLSWETLHDWLKSASPQLVDVQVPKFCFSKRLNLNDSLKQLGMKDAFTYQANFSKMNGMKDLFLNRFLHETYFSFHENGVIAASASTSHIGVISPPPPSEKAIPFIADRPFLFFLIDHHTHTILFMGRVANPKFSECL